jgi:hypothetical protein
MKKSRGWSNNILGSVLGISWKKVKEESEGEGEGRSWRVMGVVECKFSISSNLSESS